MTRDARRALWWLPLAALLLAFGFLAWLGLGAYLAGRSLDTAGTGRLHTAFVLYARVTLFKGLLPALALAFALWPLVERGFGLARRGALARALGIVAASAVASTAVAALLLPSPLWGSFSVVRYAGVGHLAQTCVEMTAGVAAALLLAHWLLRSRAQLPVWLSGAALACIAGGFLLPPPSAPEKTAHAPTAAPIEPAHPAPAPTAAPAAVTPIEPAPDYPVTSLPLTLLATQVESLESQSSAVIVDLTDLSSTRLHIGDSFAKHPAASLARIETQRVLIDNDGRLEQLVVGGHPELLLAGIARNFERHGWKQPEPESLEYQRDAAARLRERIDDPPEPKSVASGLLADATPTPIYDGEALVGYQLDEVRPGGVYDQIGLRDGDRIDAINGVGIGAPGARDAVIAALTKSPGFSIAVARRDGKRETIAVPTEQILRALAGLDAGKELPTRGRAPRS